MKTYLSVIMLTTLIFALAACSDDDGITEPELPKTYFSIEPDSLVLGGGQKSKLRIHVGSVEEFFAGSLDLVFDEEIVRVTDVTVPNDGILGPYNTLCVFEDTGDGISIGLGRIQSDDSDGVSGEGVLLDVELRGQNEGTTKMTLRRISMIDETGKSRDLDTDIVTSGATVMVSK
jgi:hypothetical protein